MAWGDDDSIVSRGGAAVATFGSDDPVVTFGHDDPVDQHAATAPAAPAPVLVQTEAEGEALDPGTQYRLPFMPPYQFRFAGDVAAARLKYWNALQGTSYTDPAVLADHGPNQQLFTRTLPDVLRNPTPERLAFFDSIPPEVIGPDLAYQRQRVGTLINSIRDAYGQADTAKRQADEAEARGDAATAQALRDQAAGHEQRVQGIVGAIAGGGVNLAGMAAKTAAAESLPERLVNQAGNAMTGTVVKGLSLIPGLDAAAQRSDGLTFTQRAEAANQLTAAEHAMNPWLGTGAQLAGGLGDPVFLGAIKPVRAAIEAKYGAEAVKDVGLLEKIVRREALDVASGVPAATLVGAIHGAADNPEDRIGGAAKGAIDMNAAGVVMSPIANTLVRGLGRVWSKLRGPVPDRPLMDEAAMRDRLNPDNVPQGAVDPRQALREAQQIPLEPDASPKTISIDDAYALAEPGDVARPSGEAIPLETGAEPHDLAPPVGQKLLENKRPIDVETPRAEGPQPIDVAAPGERATGHNPDAIPLEDKPVEPYPMDLKRTFTRADVERDLRAELDKQPTIFDQVDALVRGEAGKQTDESGTKTLSDATLSGGYPMHPDEWKGLSIGDRSKLQRLGFYPSEDDLGPFVDLVGDHEYTKLVDAALGRKGTDVEDFASSVLKNPDQHDPETVLRAFLHKKGRGEVGSEVVDPKLLPEGTKIDIAGDTFTVTQRRGQKVLKDGITIPAEGLEAVPVDKGSIVKPGEQMELQQPSTESRPTGGDTPSRAAPPARAPRGSNEMTLGMTFDPGAVADAIRGYIKLGRWTGAKLMDAAEWIAHTAGTKLKPVAAASHFLREFGPGAKGVAVKVSQAYMDLVRAAEQAGVTGDLGAIRRAREYMAKNPGTSLATAMEQAKKSKTLPPLKSGQPATPPAETKSVTADAGADVAAAEGVRGRLQQAMDRVHGKADVADGVRDEIVRLVKENLPSDLHGKFLVAVRDAKTMTQLRDAVGRMNDQLALYEVRRSWADAQRVADSIDLTKLDPSRRVQARALMDRLNTTGERLADDTTGRRVQRSELDAITTELRGLAAEAKQGKVAEAVRRLKGEANEPPAPPPPSRSVLQAAGDAVRGVGHGLNALRERFAWVGQRYGHDRYADLIRLGTVSKQAEGMVGRFAREHFGSDVGKAQTKLRDLLAVAYHNRAEALRAQSKDPTGIPDVGAEHAAKLMADPQIAKAAAAWMREVEPELQRMRRKVGLPVEQWNGPMQINLDPEVQSAPRFAGVKRRGIDLKAAFEDEAFGTGEYKTDPVSALTGIVRKHLAREAVHDFTEGARKLSVEPAKVYTRDGQKLAVVRGREVPVVEMEFPDANGGVVARWVPRELVDAAKSLINRAPRGPENMVERGLNTATGAQLSLGADIAPHVRRILAIYGRKLAQGGEYLSTAVPFGRQAAAINDALRMAQKPIGKVMQILVERAGADRGTGFFTRDNPDGATGVLGLGHRLLFGHNGVDVLARRGVANAYLHAMLGTKFMRSIEGELAGGGSATDAARKIEAKLGGDAMVKLGREVNGALGFMNHALRSDLINATRYVFPFVGSQSGTIPHELTARLTYNLHAPKLLAALKRGDYGQAATMLTGSLMSGALGTWIAANAVNYANTKMQTGTGRFMSENDEGHRSDVWLAPGWHLSNLDPGLSRASRLLGEKEWTNTGDPGRAAGDLPREWFNEAAGSMNQAIKLLFSAGTSAAAHLTGRPKSTKEAFLNRDYKLVDAPAGWWLPNSTGKQTISSALGDKREGETSTALIKDLGKLLGLELQHTGPADEFYQHVSKVREVRDAVHEATKAGDVAKAQKLMRDAGSLGDEKLWGQVEKAVREIHQLDRAIEQAKTPKERRELQQQRETALESANTALRPLRKRPAK